MTIGTELAKIDFKTIDIRGQSLRLLRHGSGTPLLWLRGTDASDAWLGYMDELSADFDVITPEHPGFGNVEKPEWLDVIGDMANFYFDLMDGLDLTHVHLAGHGLGAGLPRRWPSAILASWPR